MNTQTFDLSAALQRIKSNSQPEKLGMILIHNGVVRQSSRDGTKTVSGMTLSYDRKQLEEIISSAKQNPCVADIAIWINEGELKVGDDIMYVILAGERRSCLLPIFEWIIEKLKNDVVKEVEHHRE